MLWSPKSKLPLWWDYSSDNELERFLIEKGLEPLPFFRKCLNRNNGSTYLPGRIILNWIFPLISSLFQKTDPVDLAVKFLPVIISEYMPGVIYRRVRKEFCGSESRSYMIYINDPGFSEYLDWNYDFIGLEQLLRGGAMFGLPQFSGVSMLADTRDPISIIWRPDDKIQKKDGSLYLNGERIGILKSSKEYFSEQKLNLEEFNVPEEFGWFIERDYTCPIRNRVVLHKGCLYQSPLFSCVLTHPSNISFSLPELIRHLVKDGIVEDGVEEKELLLKHNRLLKSFEAKADFVYFSSNETVTLNGEFLVKGIPAKILRQLLVEYLDSGKTEFEYRDFKRNLDITLGQKNSNFEVRFYRLAQKFEEKFPSICLEKSTRGRFLLRCDCEIGFSEK